MSSASLDQHYEIHEHLKEGLSLTEIHEKTGVNYFYLERNYKCYLKKQLEKPLGHKSEPYYESEEEMLKESIYTYESLSDSEKEIYDYKGD